MNEQSQELRILESVAEHIGLYPWTYKSQFAQEKGLDTKEHIGPTAQELQQVAGLDGAVTTDTEGHLMVDNNYISMATLGLVAALARIVLSNYYVQEEDVL